MRFKQSGNEKELKMSNPRPFSAQKTGFVQDYETGFLHKTAGLCRFLSQIVTFQEPVFLQFFFTFRREAAVPSFAILDTDWTDWTGSTDFGRQSRHRRGEDQ